MKNDYLLYLISKLSTNTNITRGVERDKTIHVTQNDIDKYGRDNIISLLEKLEKEPDMNIKVKWNYIGVKKCDVERFKIPMNKLTFLCKMAGVDNKADQISDYKKFLEIKIEETNGLWINGYYKKILNSINNGTIPKKIEDYPFHLGLFALCKNQEPLYYRTFSQKTYHLIKDIKNTTPSKIFENYKASYANIIKKYHPEANEEMKEQELLELCNLYSYSQNFEYLGNMDINLNNGSIIGNNVYTGVILNTKALREAESVSLSKDITHIITIENKDNFYSMKYDPHVLYIFVHGFLSPIEQKLCKKINNEANKQNIEMHHWGDMDYGGIRIYKHMKTLFPSIKPYKMSKNDYLDILTKTKGYQLSKTVRKKLEKINAEELEELKREILTRGICIEQEEQLLS